jgi:glycerol 2-dehydrogenase (NADP+)
MHVYNPQHKLTSYLRSKGIFPSAYSPLGSTSAPLLTDEIVTKIAKKHSTQPASVLIGYLGVYMPFLRLFCSNLFSLFLFSSPAAKKIVVIPRSTNKERIAANFTGAITVSKALDAADIEELDGVAAAGKQTR